MKVLVVGSGGREHAIIKKLKESAAAPEIFAWPGNGGIALDATCVGTKAADVEGMVAFAKGNQIDFVVVAPEEPLVLGAVDRLHAVGIPAFGPTAAAAEIEGSKVFTKNLMKKYGIPTAAYEVFTQADAALAYIEEQGKYPVVIKADGLAAGKGVLIPQNRQEAQEALHTIMEEKAFGDSGDRVVVEEFLTGPEVSVLAFTDGNTLVPMLSSMDHKRALDGDEGLNTGGMGTVAPNPYYTPAVAQLCMQSIFMPTVAAMNAEGRPFRGCLYFGLMLTPDGPRVIEYNCRFGDPETQVVLPLLKTDLLTAMQATANGTLHQVQVENLPGYATCVVLASGGYPGAYETGMEIQGLEDAQATGAMVYHSGTATDGGKIFTAGGRVLGVTATGATLEAAIAAAYAGADKITFAGKHCRRDIGQKALQAEGEV
ncbi:phosphoribosylamine--glycine ligase [Ruminococcaceae bacterium OttesenSCG-928-N02]|nr:phosphoribosylamine--glycine ligase [Ruminococcaceae bacterium OttesenSCG-928-N02]